MTPEEFFLKLNQLDGLVLSTLHQHREFRITRDSRGRIGYLPSSGAGVVRRPTMKAVKSLLQQFFGSSPRAWGPGHYTGTRNASYFLSVMKHLGY
jgi:hypothetical protein